MLLIYLFFPYCCLLFAFIFSTFLIFIKTDSHGRGDIQEFPCVSLKGHTKKLYTFCLIDLCKSNQIIIQAIVALTADKLAGGPLREHLKKTQEKTALRSLQFWEDAQRYLLPLEDFGSYSKFHSAKTLIATYIAPDSPRQMAMSPRVRDDLMRLLPGEKGDHLLATVVKNSVQVIG